MIKEKITFEENLNIYISGGFPLLMVDTLEIDRAIKIIIEFRKTYNKNLSTMERADEFLKENGLELSTWDVVHGVSLFDLVINSYKEIGQDTDDPIQCLRYILDVKTKPGIFILQNYHFFWNDERMKPTIVQLLKDIYTIGKRNNKYIIMVGLSIDIPTEIKKYITMIDFSLPDLETIRNFISDCADTEEIELSENELEDIAIAAKGLSLQEIEGAICVSLVKSKGKIIDKETIFAEKINVVKSSGLIEHIQTEDMDNVGGLSNAKRWAKKISKAFLNPKKAKEYNLPSPKGCIVAGISGTGKSLFGKALAKTFGVELYKVDVGKIFGHLVGQTEKQTRELFKLMEGVSPAVFLCDEFEKSMSGLGSSDKSDSGVTARFIGSFLSFMQDTKAPVFIVATANDVRKLPCEIMRKGRFDSIWWVDLPSAKERLEILNIHIKKSGRNPAKFKSLDKIALSAEGLSGAEIEHSIKEAMYDAFNEERNYTEKDIAKAVKDIVPLAITAKEDIDFLKTWSVGRATKANDCSDEKVFSMSDTKRKITYK